MLVEAHRIDLSPIQNGDRPNVTLVGTIERDEKDSVFVHVLPDGRKLAHLFIFDERNPVVNVYRVRPEAFIGYSERNVLVIDDSEDADFPMKRVSKLSPKSPSFYLTLKRNGSDVAETICFSCKL